MAARWMVFAAALGGVLAAGAVQAQVNGPVPGPYGAEDGYNDDGFGWGPAYRPETNFRPSTGIYGGVERPYPYGPAATPTAVEDAPSRRRARHVTKQRRHAVAHRHATRSRSE
jgi:hypothetical protein